MKFEYFEKWKSPETGRYRKHVYLLDGKPATGVTTILGIIAKPALIQWSSDMNTKFLKEHGVMHDEHSMIVSLEQLEEARTYHSSIKESAGTRGTDIHLLVEAYIKDRIEKNEGNPDGYITDPDGRSIAGQDTALNEFIIWALKNKVKFLASEVKVYSEEWFACGTFDFSFEKEGKRYIGDLKTYKKMWDRVPFLQTAAYRKMSMEMGEKPYDGSCIVNINKDTNQLTDYWSYDWESDQKAFEAALTLYRQLSNF